MHPLEASILEEFRRDPSKTYSTTEMVRELFKQEYATINQQIHSDEKHQVRKGQHQKAQLHRKLLYHVNKMVEEKLLHVVGVRGKGEKLFRLSLEEGELVVQAATRKIIISKPATLTTQIDGYEKEGTVRKYRPETWLNKHNAILLDCHAFASPEALQQRIQQIFPAVNDAIALDRFEHLLHAPPEAVEQFLRYLALDAHDYDISVAILIDYHALNHGIEILAKMLNDLPSNISFTFNVNPRLVSKQEEEFKQLLKLFSEKKRKLTLKNASLFSAPIFFGRAGPYSFSAEDWTYYKKWIRGKADGCVVGQTTVVIDINRHFQRGGSLSAFREMATRAAHALFEIEEQRRKHFSDYFGMLAIPDLDAGKAFFKAGRHYLRFWNYDWAAKEEYPLVELLGSVKEELEKFSTLQETIFKSCGLPIRFKMALSTSFAKFDQDVFSERRYKKTAIANVKDLQTTEAKTYLHIRERLYKTFEGADRLRFFLAPGIHMDETYRIARYLLTAYDLPSITIDFRGKSGELKLTSFMEET